MFYMIVSHKAGSKGRGYLKVKVKFVQCEGHLNVKFWEYSLLSILTVLISMECLELLSR